MLYGITMTLHEAFALYQQGIITEREMFRYAIDYINGAGNSEESYIRAVEVDMLLTV